ncbi:MAG: hypothetical protein EXR99_13060 [Gemmataceae bacterium]|nr:hypothetical protein [Gemmataceae bacterium]
MRLLFLFWPLALILGCGGPNLSLVQGKVTCDGQPVAEGFIQFIPSEGKAAQGEIKGGNYSLTTYRNGDGALVGDHKVVIHATSVGPSSYEEPKSVEEEIKKSRGQKILVPGKVTWVVPEKYSLPASSDLTAKVKETINQIDFNLKKE